MKSTSNFINLNKLDIQSLPYKEQKQLLNDLSIEVTKKRRDLNKKLKGFMTEEERNKSNKIDRSIIYLLIITMISLSLPLYFGTSFFLINVLFIGWVIQFSFMGVTLILVIIGSKQEKKLRPSLIERFNQNILN